MTKLDTFRDSLRPVRKRRRAPYGLCSVVLTLGLGYGSPKPPTKIPVELDVRYTASKSEVIIPVAGANIYGLGAGLPIRQRTWPTHADLTYRKLIDNVSKKTGVPLYVLQTIVDHASMFDRHPAITRTKKVVHSTHDRLGLSPASFADHEVTLRRAAIMYKQLDNEVGERNALMVYFSDGSLRAENGQVYANRPLTSDGTTLMNNHWAAWALGRKGEPSDE